MKAWIVNLMLDVLRILCRRAHDWLFDPERHARIRFRNRERWWAYKCKADATKDPKDDMRARAWQIEFDFKTSPDDAVKRGDLNMAQRDMAMKSVEKSRDLSRYRGEHQL
jgi:hypothetical protein